MGKIFGICGNYEVDGKWKGDNISFKGWFALNDDGSFIGICVEDLGDIAQGRRRSDYIPDAILRKRASIPRFIVGTLKKRDDGHDYGITFYMMCNERFIPPMKYTIPDLGSEHPEEKGYWEWVTHTGTQRHGRARVNIKEYERRTELSEAFLRRQFLTLEGGINGNENFVREMLCE